MPPSFWPDSLACLVSFRPVSKTKIGEWYLWDDLELSSDLHVCEDACACPLWGMNTCTREHVPGPQIEPILMMLLILWVEPVGFSLGIFFATGRGKMICCNCIFHYPLQAHWLSGIWSVVWQGHYTWICFKDSTAWWSEGLPCALLNEA